MILKNVAGQGVYLFAYNSSGPKTGDAANITGYVSIDGGSAAAFGTANPTEINSTHMPGIYWQPLAVGETNGNALGFSWTDSTSGVSIDPYTILTTGANLPTAAPAASGGFLTVGSSAGQINPSSGAVPISGDLTATMKTSVTTAATAATPTAAAVTGNVGGSVVGNVGGSVGSIAGITFPAHFNSLVIDTNGYVYLSGMPKINTALNGFQFFLALSSDHYTAATGKSVTATRSINGAAFASCANAATEIGGGWYSINLASSDLNGQVIAFSFAAAGCDTAILTMITQP
jgi:hypothetical protein